MSDYVSTFAKVVPLFAALDDADRIRLVKALRAMLPGADELQAKRQASGKQGGRKRVANLKQVLEQKPSKPDLSASVLVDFVPSAPVFASLSDLPLLSLKPLGSEKESVTSTGRAREPGPELRGTRGNEDANGNVSPAQCLPSESAGVPADADRPQPGATNQGSPAGGFVPAIPSVATAAGATGSGSPVAEAQEASLRGSAPRTVARGTRLAPDWRPSPEDADFARPLVDSLDATLGAFRDYWTAIAGAKGVKLDWGATFRNWARRERGFTPPPRSNGQKWLQPATGRAWQLPEGAEDLK